MAGSPQLTLDDYKRMALAAQAQQQQLGPVAPDAPPIQAQAPPVAQVPQAAPMPNLQPPAPSQGAQIANSINTMSPQTQAPSVTDVVPKQGPIKSFLTQFIHGAGQGLLAHAGLQTDAERQQVGFNQAQTLATNARLQQTANDTTAYRQAQTGGLQAKADLADAQNQPFVIPNDPSIPASLRGQTTTVGNWQTLSKVFAQNQGKTDTQDLKNTGAQGVADTRADASTQNAQIAAQVREDVARGNLGMAAARLRLATAKANGELNGTTPTAMRLNKADLANNAQHNLGNAINIIQSDPAMFGQIAGHFTTVEQMIGSTNPNIQRLGNELHAAAQASGGVHGMRSAEAVKDTEKMWLNGFRNSPEATIAGLQAQSDSLNDYINFANYGKSPSPKIQGNITPSGQAAPTGSHPFFSQFGGQAKTP